MGTEVGLRERKRRRTFDAISAVAIAMFLERGYDNVAVSDIAAAAEVSKPTLFRYFRSKEDLVLHRIDDHRGEAGDTVRHREDGQSPLDALERHFLAGLTARDPVTGLNDDPEVLAYHGMIFSTPALSTRLSEHMVRDEEELAEALTEAVPEIDELTGRLAAAQIIAVQRILARDNWNHLVAGAPLAQRYPAAVKAASRAFAQLRDGLGAAVGDRRSSGVP